MAVHELLGGAERRFVQLLRAIQEAKAFTKLAVQRRGIIPHNVKTTAFCGSFWPERAYNHVPAWLYRVQDLFDIRYPLFGFRKKVKYRAIMP